MSNWYGFVIRSSVLQCSFRFEGGRKYGSPLFVRMTDSGGVAGLWFLASENGYVTSSRSECMKTQSGGTAEDFEKLCRKWVRQRIRMFRREGYLVAGDNHV